MKKRSAEILQRLIEAPSHRLRLDSLMGGYRLSEKTLKADISAAAAFARSPHGTSMVELSSEHVSLAADADIEGLQELIDGMDFYEYRLSFDERKYTIACMMLMLETGSWCSMQQIADALFVTRNTVISDMKAVDEYLAAYGIPLVSKSKLGMRVDADPERARVLLIDMYADILRNRQTRCDYFSGALAQILDATYMLDDVLDASRVFLRGRNIFLSEAVESEIVACLMVMLNWPGMMLIEARDPSLPLDVIGELIRFVGVKLGMPAVDNGAIAQAERVILSRNLSPQIRRFDDFDLYCVITHFLMLVGRGLNIDIQNDDLLVESLLSHLKSVASWSSDAFEVPVTGPSGVMVDMVMSAASPHFAVLEDYLNRPMDASMRSSVVIHICAALYRSESALRQCRVLVACPSSIATSKYLEAQVKSFFKIDVVDVVSTGAVCDGEADLTGIDFVISTVPIQDVRVPVVVVSPVLSVEDINKIQACAFRQSRTDPSLSGGQTSMVAKICEVYAQGNPGKTRYLNAALARVLEEVERIEAEAAHTSPLLRMLERRFIRVEGGELAWRDAMHLASEDLMSEGYFTSEYVDAAINNVEEFGSYIVLNQGIALAHAGHENGVLKDGLALLVSREGVVFDGGERVHLLFFFSQVSDGDYLDLFREIIRLGNDRASFERVRDVETPDEAYRFLVETLTDYSAGV